MNNHVEVMSGTNEPRVRRGQPVWQKASNTFGYMVETPKSTWRTYGTKAQRQEVRKLRSRKVSTHTISIGAAMILGLALSHIYAKQQ